MNMSKNMQPIGYWLKHLDGLLEADLAAVLRDVGLDRRKWQVLNTLVSGPLTPAELTAAMAPFDEADAVTALLDLGWVSRIEGAFALTGAGRLGHTETAARVRYARRRITNGISDEDYVATVAVLERMATNLTTSSSPPRGW
ncbi:MarR family transcriptional regulator [Allokutzneria sp. NRRL B-24872]|uniref:MarR family transcriptional regulator n=1 Tax=Allokutzneria sp. NRRL B-24872 TaxID=1137961 RepID=UPI001FEF3739|nr:MarR family transcriptional regulator [Allokutzneria sp. NRRL B-24872]